MAELLCLPGKACDDRTGSSFRQLKDLSDPGTARKHNYIGVGLLADCSLQQNSPPTLQRDRFWAWLLQI